MVYNERTSTEKVLLLGKGRIAQRLKRRVEEEAKRGRCYKRGLAGSWL